jgi:hypothetical protein
LETRSGTFIVVPANSQNTLAQAIQSAGVGGTVFLEPGLHTESTPITIKTPVTLIGEEGTILKIKVQSATLETATIPNIMPIYPALHVMNAPQTVLINIEFQPFDQEGGTAILFQNTPMGGAISCSFKNFQNTVVVESAPKSTFINNRIIASPQSKKEPGLHTGFMIINGQNTYIGDNQVELCKDAIFVSDKYGTVTRNILRDNNVGVSLSSVYPNSMRLPNNYLTGSLYPAYSYQVNNNLVTGVQVAYMLSNAANTNYFTNNQSTNCTSYDFELLGNTNRTGFYMPETFNNRIAAQQSQKIKDCGNLNTIYGGTLINKSADPCQ